MIIASMATSVDGRYGGPDRELDWQSFDDEFRAYSNELLDRADGLLLGRVTFEEIFDLAFTGLTLSRGQT